MHTKTMEGFAGAKIGSSPADMLLCLGQHNSEHYLILIYGSQIIYFAFQFCTDMQRF